MYAYKKEFSILLHYQSWSDYDTDSDKKGAKFRSLSKRLI